MTGSPATVRTEPRLEIARSITTIALAIATFGIAIPFGSSSGATTLDLTPLEWALSVAAFLAACGLVLDFWHPWRSRLYHFGLAEMATGFVWAAIGAYELLLPGEVTLNWRLGHALPAFGWAVLALTTWRWVIVGEHYRHHGA